ncbi:hypothetical protein LINPERHAP2_LOCUS41327, partial [Linum perenne]
QNIFISLSYFSSFSLTSSLLQILSTPPFLLFKLKSSSTTKEGCSCPPPKRCKRRSIKRRGFFGDKSGRFIQRRQSLLRSHQNAP